MMFMRMMGGGNGNGNAMPQGVFMGAQQGIGAEDIKGIISVATAKPINTHAIAVHPLAASPKNGVAP